MKNRKKYAMLCTITLLVVCLYACRKENLIGLPQVRTLPITDVINGTAKSGGEIISNGGKEIIFSGIAWSKTNNSPTISDDTTKSISQSKFMAILKNVDPSSTYYIRAYATTEMGVGYGEVMTITTENGLPQAQNLKIEGGVEIDQIVSANYVYFDFENNDEGQTTYQWFSANDATGAGETMIAGASAKNFKIDGSLDKKFLRVVVTPKAIAGTLVGNETKSVFVGPVGEATTVTFMYNGSQVIYNILTSATTGRKWLDRNLGAPNTPASVGDYANFGDLFQWGRAADGHQLTLRNGPADADMVRVNGFTSTPFTTINPSSTLTPLFQNSVITDWTQPSRDDLWQMNSGINNPCPSGWYIPTQADWAAEGLSSVSDAFSKLKITYSGYIISDQQFYQSANTGNYWSSTIAPGNPNQAIRIRMNAGYGTLGSSRFTAMACRCIKE